METKMYRIISKKVLAPNIYQMTVHAKYVARACQPGQFVIIRLDEKGERIPLTICDYDRETGTVTIVFQAMGASTNRLAQLNADDFISDFSGPLGCASELVHQTQKELNRKEILFVAGGVGTAPVYPQVKLLKERGAAADCIIGARNKAGIILEEEMRQAARNVYITTDDGSYGLKGNVNDCIRQLLQNQGKQYDLIIAIGPLIMMKYVSLLTKELGIRTIVSMNPIMVDGTGMCGACRLTVGKEVKFACVDGPEFDGHLVDFDESMKRQKLYKTEEGRSLLREQEGIAHKGGGCGCNKE
jgi:ferredoxin/flavodoxin---NADP+ reductase